METKWFYYVHEQGNTIARVNTDAFELLLGEMGFHPCAYKEYLNARKVIREQERIEKVQQIINFEGKVPGEDNDNN